MASAGITISYKVRPCLVSGKKALFHKWADKAEVLGESLLRGGHPAGQLWLVVGIVEYEDGCVREAMPNQIQFIDNPMEGYAWPNTADSL